MQTIEATVPCSTPPAWAILERALFDLMDRAVGPFLDKYARADGSLIWRDTWGRSRDGADDFYESSVNWPLLFLLGGGDHLLPLAHHQWEGITKQLTALGPIYNEYERGYDQFHQSESYTYFYTLCLADPENPRLRERARRFAGLYLNEDPEAPNYDAERKLIRAPHNGSGGPRWGIGDGEPSYSWSQGMARYGLPFHDVPGITSYDDLKDPALARRMGEAMRDRMGKGDVATNLCVTSLVTNAHLLTGDEKYRRWVVDYVDAWRGRAAANGGLLPDQIGLSGKVGEYLGGKWYGGLYGWTWPHGFYNLEMAALVAAANALLLTRDAGYLDLPRTQMERVLALGVRRRPADQQMSLGEHWVGQTATDDPGGELLVVPYRHGDGGWFDYQPLSPIFPAALWNLSMAEGDRARLRLLREQSGYDWRRVRSFRTKEDAGHEQPWLTFLAGESPSYPEEILRAGYGQVCRRLEQIRQDQADLTNVNIHHWQELNPVTTEALVQLTLGAPQSIYNGGLLQTRVRYFDAERRRPGLPRDVAALVESLQPDRTALHLVNVGADQARDVIVQAGAFGEHQFLEARFSRRTSDYPGPVGSYAVPPLETEMDATVIDDSLVHIHLSPATELRLDLHMARFVNEASYALPWQHDGGGTR